MFRFDRKLVAVLALLAAVVATRPAMANPEPYQMNTTERRPVLQGPEGWTTETRPRIWYQLPYPVDLGDWTLSIYLDRRPVQSEYDPASRQISYTPAEPLAPGLHTVMVRQDSPWGTYKIEKYWAFVVGERPQVSVPLTEPSPLAQEVVAMINSYREAAGLQPLMFLPGITGAAQGHMNYLDQNQLYMTIYEEPGLPGFIGATPADQVLSFGPLPPGLKVAYEARTGQSLASVSMFHLSSRALILDPTARALGVAVGAAGSYRVWALDSTPSREPVLWPPPGMDGVSAAGDTVSVNFGDWPVSLEIDEFTLADSSGEHVPVRLVRELWDRIIGIDAIGMLQYDTIYTARMAGRIDWGDGWEPLELTWSFRTEPDPGPLTSVMIIGVDAEGDGVHDVRIRAEVQGFRPDMRFYLGSLPVRDLRVEVESEETDGVTIVSFLRPTGYRVGVGRDFVVWEDDSVWINRFVDLDLEDDSQEAFTHTRRPIAVGSRTAEVDVVAHADGALLLPEESFRELGVEVDHDLFQWSTRLTVDGNAVYVGWGYASTNEAYVIGEPVSHTELGVWFLAGRAYFPLEALERIAPVTVGDNLSDQTQQSGP